MKHQPPRLTRALPGARGVYKQRPEDFLVEEQPAYEPCGEGDHTYFQVQKTGLSTHDAAGLISTALGVPPRAIGYAGLKDAQAVTRQWMSVEHVDAARVHAFKHPKLEILKVSQHGNKLRVGHLRGNHFALKLRDVPPDHVPNIEAVLDVLQRRGVPNYFGEQRFGARGDGWCIGRALLQGKPAEVVALVCGRPTEYDHGPVKRARELFDEGSFEESARTWPGGFRDSARLARAMARSKGRAGKAMRAMPRNLQRFFVSAYQSHLFNLVLAERIDELDAVQVGDLAYKHDHGAVFRVEDVAAELPRAEAFEISATGPLYGRRMTRASGAPGELEQRIEEAELTEGELEQRGPLSWKGARRPLRVPLREAELEVGLDDVGPFCALRFSLPPGSYATSVLAELLRS